MPISASFALPDESEQRFLHTRNSAVFGLLPSELRGLFLPSKVLVVVLSSDVLSTALRFDARVWAPFEACPVGAGVSERLAVDSSCSRP